MSPTDTTPCFVSGSSDIMTSINSYCERRPGFSLNVEPTPTAFTNMQRLFSWDRFDGTFIEHACDVVSNQAVVYKRIVGVDNSFSSIFTDTGSTALYDFVVSNNSVYFSNGSKAKKYNPTNGVTNWGIAVGSVNNSSGPNTAGAGADSGGISSVWSNPGNVSSAVSFATNTLSRGSSSFNIGTGTNSLLATSFGFALASETIVGIQISLNASATTTADITEVSIQMLRAGNSAGFVRSQIITTSNATYTFGGPSDLWGTTWTTSDINNTNFGVGIVGVLVGKLAATGTFSVNDVQITVFGIGGPTVALTGTGLTATTGYQYVFCYGNSNSGHISSPSPVSAVIKPANQSINITLTASTDSQVNQIRLFRSTDSVAPGTIGGTFFELPTSPYANTNQTVTDSAIDTALNIFSIAPFPGFNDPPTPGQQPVYFSGRVWMFHNNKVVFSGLEEIVNGVPEESFPSGPAGNFWNFDEPVQGLAVAGTGLSQTLLVFCGGRIYGIAGSSLDTFQRFLISNRRGTRNLNTVTSLGGLVAWFDSAAQIWGTDGQSLQELAVDIRPDLQNLLPAGANFTFHTSGRYHWLVCAFSSKIFVLDLDTQQWMPPWSLATTAMYSGETAPGVYNLMASTGTKAIMLNSVVSSGAYNDNGNTYQPVIKTANFSMVPDFGRRFSYAAVGLYDEPSRTGMGWYFQSDTNSSQTFSDVGILVDDDPTNSSSVYQTIFANALSPAVAWNRSQGVNLIQNIFSMNGPTGRWISIKLTLTNADQVDKIYQWFLAYSQKR